MSTQTGVIILAIVASSVPPSNIDFPPYFVAKTPPGICVIKYPQKNDDKIIPCNSSDQSNCPFGGDSNFKINCVILWI